jgi:hypothetical protein
MPASGIAISPYMPTLIAATTNAGYPADLAP